MNIDGLDDPQDDDDPQGDPQDDDDLQVYRQILMIAKFVTMI